MLRSCRNGVSKHVGIWRINHQHRLVLASQLHTWKGPAADQAVIGPPKVLDSVGLPQSTAESQNVLASLEFDSRLLGKRKDQVNVSVNLASIDDFFTQLSRMLADGSVSGTTLWHFVWKRFPRLAHRRGYIVTQTENILLGHVLHRILEEWATRGIHERTIPLLLVLQTYVARNYMRRTDWVHFLSFLAKTAYQKINLHAEQPNETSISDQIAHAIHIGVLCKAWMVFFFGNDCATSEPMARAGQYGNLWPNLRERLTLPRDTGIPTDFVQQFMNATAEHYLSDPNLDRELAYTSILTLVVIYTNVRAFEASSVNAKKDTSTSFGNDSCASGKEDSSETPPDRHLRLEQSYDWPPEIGHLSVDEASILYVVAHAAKDATLNLTLLKIKLAQLSLPARDVNEIARIYQHFKSAVPTMMSKFQTFKYDESVYKLGLLRRYPLRAYLESAVASNDVKALDKACSLANRYEGAAKSVLAVFNAFLQRGCSSQALLCWNVLASRGHLRKRAWKMWLDFAFQQNDLVTFETAWDKSRTYGMTCTAKMWHQRLLLLHQSNQPSAAWKHFCTLVRLSAKDQKMVGMHRRRIAPSILEMETFHMMINAFLGSGDSPAVDVGRAEEVLQLLKKQEGLKVTRETYLLFIEHSLRRGARQSAVDWFIEGHSLHVEFLPADYALLFEYDLVKHNGGRGRQLFDASASIRDCLDAISRTMHIVRSRQIFKWSSYQFPHLSPNIEAILTRMPLVDSVVDDVGDANLKKIQTVYAGIMEYLAQHFPEQRTGAAKTARLRLLLLLWDHCVTTGVPASTQMEATLRSTIYSMNPELQEKLMRGAMFHNYNDMDPVVFNSYRFLRLIGPYWFTERIRSIPSGPTKTHLTRLEWSGYNAVTDAALAGAGIASWQDRRKILDEVMAWKNEAAARRMVAAKKKEARKQEMQK